MDFPPPPHGPRKPSGASISKVVKFLNEEDVTNIETVAPAWIDYALLSRWRLFDYSMAGQAAVVIPQIEIGGIQYAPRDLTKIEKKRRKTCFYESIAHNGRR